MTEDEIRKVKDRYFTTTHSRRTTDNSRDCNWMQSKRINGLSSDAAQSRVNICKQDWHGWSRTQKTDYSCTERMSRQAYG